LGWCYGDLGIGLALWNSGIVDYKSNGKDLSVDLLNGISGIGLVLLIFLSSDERNWDECLLLS
jgi:hypothetical protein